VCQEVSSFRASITFDSMSSSTTAHGLASYFRPENVGEELANAMGSPHRDHGSTAVALSSLRGMLWVGGCKIRCTGILCRMVPASCEE